MFRHTTILAFHGAADLARLVALGVHRAVRSRSNKFAQILGGREPKAGRLAAVPAGFELPTRGISDNRVSRQLAPIADSRLSNAAPGSAPKHKKSAQCFSFYSYLSATMGSTLVARRAGR